MAAPFPKPKEQRRNRTAPHRGEWVDLEPLESPVLPPFDDAWEVKRQMWEAWRRDPVTSQYGEADVAAIVMLAEEFYALPPAQRLAAMDKLGLTPKGKRDLRWRTPAEVATLKTKKPAEVRRLRAVAPDAMARS